MPAWRRGDPTSDLPELVPPGELDTGQEQATDQAGPPERGSEPGSDRQAPSKSRRKQPARRKTAQKGKS